MPRDATAPHDPSRRLADALAHVTDALARLKYGAIQLTVHDGRVQQIEVTEKHRLTD